VAFIRARSSAIDYEHGESGEASGPAVMLKVGIAKRRVSTPARLTTASTQSANSSNIALKQLGNTSGSFQSTRERAEQEKSDRKQRSNLRSSAPIEPGAVATGLFEYSNRAVATGSPRATASEAVARPHGALIPSPKSKSPKTKVIVFPFTVSPFPFRPFRFPSRLLRQNTPSTAAASFSTVKAPASR